MENIEQKAKFLKEDFTKALASLDANAARKWGKMNVQQMIEHMSDYVRIASGKTPMETITPAENIPKMQAFLESEKPMRENTPNPLLPDVPPPVRHATKEAAIAELQDEIDHFFAVHEQEAGRATPNPFFGTLSFEQQVQLLYKHGTHHLRQFGVDV
jgi:hypothetical protein